MKIYFVRHGEGEHNVKKLYSTPDFSLTKKGKEEAAFVAKRISKLPIDIIICSSYLRAIQTAEIINRELSKEIIQTDLAVEIKRPREIAGKYHLDPKVVNIKNLMDSNSHLPKWHYSDEENFYDLRERTKKFIKYLGEFKQENILVVTHLHTVRMVVLTMLFQDNLTPEIFLKATESMNFETSGLTVCEQRGGKWRLVTWNDQSHLADPSQGFSG